MPRTLVIHAHPRPSQSLVIKAMQAVFEGDAHTETRNLYDLYPDFDIHVSAEQQALARANLVVWLAPIHWYSVPALLKHWFDQVLAHGWAFGPGGDALRGKTAWWVASAGGSMSDYASGGAHQRPFADFVAPIEQTARFCGMRWLPPHIEYGGHSHTGGQLAACTDSLAAQFARHRAAQPSAPAAA
jgi:glutathione-regulated potassium-efflux system ancillary protein KefF